MQNNIENMYDHEVIMFTKTFIKKKQDYVFETMIELINNEIEYNPEGYIAKEFYDFNYDLQAEEEEIKRQAYAYEY